jgi:hypothetical protein
MISQGFQLAQAKRGAVVCPDEGFQKKSPARSACERGGLLLPG